MQPISTFSMLLLGTGFIYSLVVSWLAYRQTGRKWMLYMPQWIDANSGVTRHLRMHGMAAFTLLFVATIIFFYEQS